MNQELQTIQPAMMVEPNPIQPTPMMLIQMAMQSGASMDSLERLIKLQETVLARESEMAFNASLNRCQSQMTRIAADASNPMTKSRYATYAAIDRAIRPVYTSEGFSVSYDTQEAEGENVTVVAILSHSGGHSRTYHITMPNDGKGAKGNDVMTRTHAQGAAVAYGRRYLLCSIFNVAVGEEDRDGNAGKVQMAQPTLDLHLSALEQSKDAKALEEAYHTAYEDAKKVGDKSAIARIVAAKDARKKIIGGAK